MGIEKKVKKKNNEQVYELVEHHFQEGWMRFGWLVASGDSQLEERAPN